MHLVGVGIEVPLLKPVALHLPRLGQQRVVEPGLRGFGKLVGHPGDVAGPDVDLECAVRLLRRAPIDASVRVLGLVRFKRSMIVIT